MEESLNSKEKAKRLPRTDITFLQNITVMTSAVDVLIRVNAINPKTVSELLK